MQPKDPATKLNANEFATLTDATFIRRSGGFRIQRRLKAGSASTYQEQRAWHVVLSARVRSDGLTMDAMYAQINSLALFTTPSLSFYGRLGRTDAASVETVTEGYSSLPSATSPDPLATVPCQVDNWNCQDHGDGTSTITVSLAGYSAWVDV